MIPTRTMTSQTMNHFSDHFIGTDNHEDFQENKKKIINPVVENGNFRAPWTATVFSGPRIPD